MIEDIRIAVEWRHGWQMDEKGRSGAPSRRVLQKSEKLQVKIDGVWQDIRQEVVVDESKDDTAARRRSRVFK